MTAMDIPYRALCEKLHALHLDAFVRIFEDVVHKDPDRAARVAPLLESMVDEEQNIKGTARITRCIKEAHFIRIQTVDTFDFQYNASTKALRKRYLRLFEAPLEHEGIGALFIGNAGLGKTHLARALGYGMCQRKQSVLFLPCATLLNRLVAAEATRDLERLTKKLQSPTLLIIDELAYVTMSQQESNLFFQVISRRHDSHRPTVVTSNKPFAQWNQVFCGDAIACAIVDRLTERAELFYLEGNSYRQTHRKGL